MAEATVVQQDEAFKIETEGIGIILDEHRHGHPRELAFVWLAAALTFTGIVIGQLFTSLGLSVFAALIVSLLVALTFGVLGLISAAGPRAGTATLTISRAAFGLRGNVVPALFSWLSAVGWEAVTLVLTVLAFLSLAQIAGVPSSGPLPTALALVVTLILTYVVPLLGRSTVAVMQRYFSYALALAGILVLIAVLPKVDWAYSVPVKDMAAKGPFPTFLLALSIGIIASGVWSWSNFAADYSRYLPKDTKPGAVVRYTLIGGGLGTFIVLAIGVLLGSFINASAFAKNPALTIAHSVPAWATVPFLVVMILGDVTANFLNAYSSGMSFLSMGIRLKRYQAVFVDAVLCTLIALYALFIAPGFQNFFESFLSLNIVVIGTWSGIFLVHHWLSNGRYDSQSLVRFSPDSAYWYTGGVNWAAMGAFFLAAFGTWWTINSSLWVSPLSGSLFGGADLSAFAAPILAGGLYYLLTRMGLAGEVSRSVVTPGD